MPQRILLIEDERSIAEAVLYALRSEGFEASWVQTGQEGIRSCEGDIPTLVVLDIGLPDINGLDVCRQIRRHCSVPIIFLTARAEEVDRIVGLELGADDYIAKPFSPRELTARIRAVLRRIEPRQGISEKVSVGPFSIDPARYQIDYHQVALSLSRYEYGLLKALLEQPGRVLSREQLMAKVWEHPDHSLERTVDTHIKTVRAKLRAVSANEDVIRTHRGIGYSIEIAK